MTIDAAVTKHRWLARLPRWHRPRTPGQRLVLAIAVIALMVLMVTPLFNDPVDLNAPKVRAGLVDFSKWKPLDRPVELAGDWQLTWFGPKPAAAVGQRGSVKVPGQWTGTRVGGVKLGASGRARYDMVVRGLAPGRYTLHLPTIWAGNRVIVDGEVVARRGRIGSSAETTTYHLRSHLVPLVATGRDIRIAVEMAAFHHRDNGMEDAPILGRLAAMENWYALKWSRELVYHVSLLLIAALAIAVFLFRPQDRASLFFGLSCLALVPMTAIIGFDNILQLMFPQLEFRTSLTIQYLSAYAAVLFFFASVHVLFPQESSALVARVLFGVFGVIAAVQIVDLAQGDTLTASFTQGYAMILALLTLVYILAILVRAAARGRDGALILLLGMGVFVGTFFVGAVVQSGWVRRDQVIGYEYTATGIVILLYSHVVLMAERWSLSVGNAEQINEDLRQLLEINTAITSDLHLDSLLDKIVAVTSKIIRAERSTLFLKDPQAPALQTLVAQGIEGGPLRVDVGRGLAGYVYATGEMVNISDAYADERFNRSVDEGTGYRTRSVLTVPIAARDGRRIGVMQALNRKGGAEFTAADAARVGAFGAQAAVAIDNARLFSEAASARNFDESILRSMSGGVIALDLDWKITKLNAAATEILGASATLLCGLDARALLPRFNPRLVEEIAVVVGSGEPKLLLDIELRTARDRPAAVNLSITPLEGDSGRVGTLLVIEDISEGKRLQGAMRRFMAQEVVDQVLARDDESLFGTACRASVLFVDIRGFTTMAEELSARETVETLNELFTELYEAVSGHGGVLDKYIGDAVMAVYGAPLPSGCDAHNAVASGLRMFQMLDAVNLRREARGAKGLRLGIGIATGEVVAGTIGSPKRMDYTVIGDSVNLAARIQDLTKTYGVEMLIDQATASEVVGVQPMREIDLIAVRGRKRPETVFEVLVRDPADPPRRAAGHAAYAEGRAALVERRWDEALAAFARAAELEPEDRPAQLLLTRTRALAAAPPDEAWDGVWRDRRAEQA